MTVASDKSSISDLVTRVKIVGKANDDEKSPVEAIVDGLTEFGIRQKIVTRSEDDTLSAAKAEAKQIIDEEGHPKRNIKLEGPDVPVMRKGDKVYVKTETINGYCYVLSIRHNADERTMSLEVEVA